jgi:thiamine kinase-like enzyme
MDGSKVINASQITPDWLNAVLRGYGVLSQGEVRRVNPGPVQNTFASAVWRLEVIYSPDASPCAPKRLFLKVSDPGLAPGEFNPTHLYQEFIFYKMVAPLMDETFTIPCYDAAYDPLTGVSHLLLLDVSGTHTACDKPSSLRHCEWAIDSLARLHAFWWDHPRLGQDIGKFITLEEREVDWLDAQKSTTAFMDALGEQLHPSWRATYESVLPALPYLYKRHAAGQNLTLVHGDAHLGNFMFPKDEKNGNTYLIDWQFWHPTIGGTDLAFMMATEWGPEVRRNFEKVLLQRYHHRLLKHGVRNYSLEDCWNDYRLSVILVSIFIPVWRWAVFEWTLDLPTLAKSMTAFEDLKCSELLS